MTSIIDNSLCVIPYLDPSFPQSEAALFEYVSKLIRTGVDYIQIDNKTVGIFTDNGFDTAKRCIFKVNCEEDFEIAARHSFAYVTIPVRYFLMREKFPPDMNINMEIYADDNISFTELYELSEKLLYFRNISMFTYIFAESQDRESFAKTLSKIRAQTISSVSVCPINTCCCGVDIATDAFSAGINAVVLCYIPNSRYTSLDEFINATCSNFRIRLSGDSAENMLNHISAVMSLEHKVKHGVSILPNHNVDTNTEQRRRMPSEEPSEGIIERKLAELELEADETDELTKILKALSADLFNDTKK